MEQKTQPSTKELVIKLAETFNIPTVDWRKSMTQMKRLLEKYSPEQIEYAIDYYSKKGVQVYSVGFLSGNMDDPCSLLVAEKHSLKGGSRERNWKRIIQNDKAKCRKDYPEHLFAETRPDD